MGFLSPEIFLLHFKWCNQPNECSGYLQPLTVNMTALLKPTFGALFIRSIFEYYCCVICLQFSGYLQSGKFGPVLLNRGSKSVGWYSHALKFTSVMLTCIITAQSLNKDSPGVPVPVIPLLFIKWFEWVIFYPSSVFTAGGFAQWSHSVIVNCGLCLQKYDALFDLGFE